jgi:hypothetical protein
MLKSYIRSGSLYTAVYRGADMSVAGPTSRCILFEGENISFDASPVIYIKSLLLAE